MKPNGYREVPIEPNEHFGLEWAANLVHGTLVKRAGGRDGNGCGSD